jgi:hypothetical protein
MSNLPRKLPQRAIIVDPKTKKEIVASPLDKFWVPGQDIEDYPWAFRNEAARLEHVAHAGAMGKLNTPGRIRRLAKRIGASPRFVRRIMVHPTMVKRIRELVRVRAAYGAAEALSSQVEAAKTDPAAFKTLAQMGKIIENQGSKAEVNVTIDRRNGGDNEAAVQFIERFRERSRLGLLRAVNAKDVTPEEVGETENGDEN